MRISDVLVLSSKKNTIDKIYTRSRHEKLARSKLNELLSERPEWFNTIYALSILPLLVWADEEKEVHPLSKRMYELGNYRFRHSRLDNGKIKKITDGIKGVLFFAVNSCQGVEGDCLRSIYLSDEDVSQYKFNMYFQNAVRHLCETQSFVINHFFTEFKKCFEHLSSEEKCVLHDIDTLFIVNRCNRRKDESKRDEDTKLLLTLLAENLGSCKVCSKETKYIISQYIEGKTEKEIGREFEKSREYVRSRISDAKKMMAVYMWGLSTNDFLSHI